MTTFMIIKGILDTLILVSVAVLFSVDFSNKSKKNKLSTILTDTDSETMNYNIYKTIGENGIHYALIVFYSYKNYSVYYSLQHVYMQAERACDFYDIASTRNVFILDLYRETIYKFGDNIYNIFTLTGCLSNVFGRNELKISYNENGEERQITFYNIQIKIAGDD